MAVPVIWDAEQTADEIRRTAAKGCHSLSFTENPAALGYPSFHDEYWDPVWQACCDTGTVLSIHLGLVGPALDPGRRLPARRDDHPPADEHPVGGGRPAVVPGPEELPRPPGGALRGRHRVDPVLPRAGRPDLRDAPRLDAAGLRGPPAVRGLPRALPDLLHQRPGGRRAAGPDRHRQHRVGGRLPPQRLDVAQAPPRSCEPRSRRTPSPTTRSAR